MSKQYAASRQNQYASMPHKASRYMSAVRPKYSLYAKYGMKGFGQAEEIVADASPRSIWPQVIAAGSVGLIVLGLIYGMNKETVGRAY